MNNKSKERKEYLRTKERGTYEEKVFFRKIESTKDRQKEREREREREKERERE